MFTPRDPATRIWAHDDEPWNGTSPDPGPTTPITFRAFAFHINDQNATPTTTNSANQKRGNLILTIWPN